MSLNTHAPVTFPVLGMVISGAAGVYVFLAAQHAVAGHARHDAQIEQAELRSRAELQGHVESTRDTFHRFEAALQRMETKQDALLESRGVPFPANAPPLRDLAKPGGRLPR